MTFSSRALKRSRTPSNPQIDASISVDTPHFSDVARRRFRRENRARGAGGIAAERDDDARAIDRRDAPRVIERKT